MVNSWNLGGTLFGTIDLLADGGTLAWAISALTTFLLATWFITSSDSGTLVVTTILSMGNAHPPKIHRIIWGAAQGLVAAVLLMAGGLSALQTAAIAAALPISVLVVMMAWGVIKSLLEDPAAVSGAAESAPDGTAMLQKTPKRYWLSGSDVSSTRITVSIRRWRLRVSQ